MESMTPESVRQVRFRAQLRGYHPEDVDAFVSRVAAELEHWQQQVTELQAQLAQTEEQASASASTEDSLRRTLILAQRTADLAIQEARDEAAALVAEAQGQRDAMVQEITALRARLEHEVHSGIEEELRRLHREREALLADVAALEHHLARERERLRIYFTDQLRRVEAGAPGVAPAPEMQGPEQAPPDRHEGGVEPEEVPPMAGHEPAAGVGFAPDVADELPEDQAVEEPPPDDDVENDAFIAELRRAVTDTQPLGPRDDTPDHHGDDDESIDLFDERGEGGGFGARLRRRR